MAKQPSLSEDEIDDLIYFARAGDLSDLEETLSSLSERESVPRAQVLTAARDEGKSSCLHMAAANGHLEIVNFLLKELTTHPSSSSPQDSLITYLNLPNEFGNTSLHWACLRGHLPVVKALHGAGASPAAVNDREEIPLDLALFAEKGDVVEFFMGLSGGLEGGNAEEAGKEGKGEDGEGKEEGLLVGGLEGVDLDDGEGGKGREGERAGAGS